jgi:two-component system, NarL family, nitrate/nitrite response regulator NarL
MDSGPAARLAGRLSPRQWQITRLIAQGRDNCQIQAELGIAHNTLRGHITQIYRRLGLQSRWELMLLAHGLGWVDLAEVTVALVARAEQVAAINSDL